MYIMLEIGTILLLPKPSGLLGMNMNIFQEAPQQDC